MVTRLVSVDDQSQQNVMFSLVQQLMDLKTPKHEDRVLEWLCTDDEEAHSHEVVLVNDSTRMTA